MSSTVEDVERYLLKARELEEYLMSNDWKSLEEESMNIVAVKYRFLRLNSQTLALVEVHKDSDTPEVCQELYPYPPYLTEERCKAANSYYNDKEIEEWKKDCKYGFNLAVSEAYSQRIIDYTDIGSYCSTVEEKEKVLWNILDPLTFWDEFVPLFDNDYNLILRD